MALFILMGPKHSGKTSVGRELARRISVSFFDLDQCMEDRTGKGIRELYYAGPDIFRREETTALTAVLQNGFCLPGGQGYEPGTVLALGGGIIDNPEAMTVLQKEMGESKGHSTFYLEISAKTAWQRIESQGELPLFLKAETPEAAKEKHRLLHERRARDYKKMAAHSIFAEGKTIAEVADELAALLMKKP
ncbi:MAG: shikimate kinase [Treponema sp.]|jgi:shikimate kinase|nr:shikimate kinase [Treponema sp.]